MCITPVGLRNNNKTVHIQYFIIVIQKDTFSGCTLQPSSGFTFHKYKKGNQTAVAIHKTIKAYVEISPLPEIFVNVTFWKPLYNI